MSQPPVPPADPFVPPEKGHALELVLGAVVGGVDVVVTGVLGLVFSANFANGAWGFAPLVVGLLIPLVLLLNESTRWWGVGHPDRLLPDADRPRRRVRRPHRELQRLT